MRYLYPILLLVFLTAGASAQRAKIGAGNGLKERRDTALVFLLDTVKVRGEIRDSIAAHGMGKDTATLAQAHMCFGAPSDTAAPQMFTSAGWYTADGLHPRIYSLSHAMGDWQIVKMSITHQWVDSLNNIRVRDTIVYASYGAYATAPRGSALFVVYIPASEYGGSPFGASDECQQIGVYYIAPNSGANPLVCSHRIQVPLLLGVAPPHKGVEDDHCITVTISAVQK